MIREERETAGCSSAMGVLLTVSLITPTLD
jgi:hypothetical protein